MKSGELAELAGVTVRALRHYHQIGLLPEPGRGGNGYRDYAVGDLIRVLRIKRLAALGIPLERIAGVLDSDERDQDQLLGEVEQAIDAEIARLEQQRVLVRLARAAEATPDLPPALARAVERFVVSGAPPAMLRREREQTVLLAHLVGDQQLARLVEVYERLAAPEILAPVLRLTHAFEALTDDAEDADVAAFVADYLAALGPVLDELGARLDGVLPDEATATALFDAYGDEQLSAAQRDALARIVERVEADEDG